MKRLECKYKSVFGKTYVITIYDRDAVSESTIDFDTTAGATIKRHGDESNPHIAIIPSSAQWSMYIENQDHWDFYNDLVQSSEGRFLVKINTYLIGESSEIPLFHGTIVQDLGQIEDRNNPVFSIQALDGLNQLKNFRFDETGNPLNNYLVKEYFHKCIKEVKWLDYFLGDDDNMVEYAIQWSSQYHADGAEVLKQTRLSNYFRRNKDGRVQYHTLYEILEDLLNGLNAQLFYFYGRYVVEQIGVKHSNTQITGYRQSYDGNTTTPIAYTPQEYNYDTNDDLCADTYPLISWLPPLKDIEVRQRGDHLDNVLLGYKWNDTSNVETIIASLDDPDGQTRLFFDSVFYSYIENASGTGTPKYAKFNLTVRNNGVYATRVYGSTYDFRSNGGLVPNIYTGESITNITWSTAATDEIQFWVQVGYLEDDTQLTYDNLLNFYKYIIFQTPPFTSGSFLSINLELEGIYTDSDFTTPYTIAAGESFKWGIDRVNRAFIGHSLDTLETSDIVTEIVVNADATVDLEHIFSMGDYPNSASLQKLQVYTGTVWRDSEGWEDPDTTGTAYFQYMAANEISAMRKKARMKLDVSIFYEVAIPLDWRDALIYDTKRMLPMSLELDTINNTTKATYFAIDKEYGSTIGTPQTDDQFEASHTLGLQSSTGSTTNLNTSAPTPPFYGIYTPQGDFIELIGYDDFPDPDEVTEDSINLSHDVFIGSTRMRFKNVAKAELQNWEYRIDKSTKQFIFNRNMGGKTIEVKAFNYYELIPPTT